MRYSAVIKNSFVFGALSVLAGMLFFLPFQSAAIMKGFSTEELTRESDTVVSGDVEDAESFWSQDGKTIITRATVSVSGVIRGKSSAGNIIVEYEGGEIGDVGLRVSDVSPLIKGERVILFLKSVRSRKDSAAVYNMVGKGQGKYTIDEGGIARKGGFSLSGGEENVDSDIPLGVLLDRIKAVK